MAHMRLSCMQTSGLKAIMAVFSSWINFLPCQDTPLSPTENSSSANQLTTNLTPVRCYQSKGSLLQNFHPMATLTAILEQLLVEARKVDDFIADSNLPPLSHKVETFTGRGVPVEIQTSRDRLINGCANVRALVEGPAIATLNIAFSVSRRLRLSSVSSS